SSANAAELGKPGNPHASLARLQGHQGESAPGVGNKIEVKSRAEGTREPASRLTLIGLEPLRAFTHRFVIRRQARLAQGKDREARPVAITGRLIDRQPVMPLPPTQRW